MNTNLSTPIYRELTTDETRVVNGGTPAHWAAAVAIVGLLGVAAEKGFNAGRQIVRDLRD